jgi:hypothetical protein
VVRYRMKEMQGDNQLQFCVGSVNHFLVV